MGMTDKSLIAVSPWPPPMPPLPKMLPFCCCPEELRHHWSDKTAVGEMTQTIGMESLSHDENFKVLSVVLNKSMVYLGIESWFPFTSLWNQFSFCGI